MDNFDRLQNDAQFVSELQSCAGELVEKLQNDNAADAAKLIEQMLSARERRGMHAAGHLAEALRDVLINFQIESDSYSFGGFEQESDTEATASKLIDASERLDYAMMMMEQAATKTMDLVDSSDPVFRDLGAEAKRLRAQWWHWHQVHAGEEFPELYNRTEQFLEQTSADMEKLQQHMQTIVLAQGFQDLTGQALAKVIRVIQDIEQQLINLATLAGEVEKNVGVAAGDDGQSSGAQRREPRIYARTADEEVSSQDDVDDLLSNLGI